MTIEDSETEIIKYKSSKYKYSNGQMNTTKIVKGDIGIPDILQVGNEIKVLVWNYSKKPTYIREMGLLLGKPNSS